MALVVEDGSGLAGAESYVSVADCAGYATARGLAFPTTDAALCEQALRRATAWLDDRYARRFPGARRRLRAQALEWPRVGVTDANGYSVPETEVPTEVVRATCEAAVRELASPNSLAPDLKRGGAIRAVKAGSVSVEYAAGASASTTFQTIDDALSRLLAFGGGGSLISGKLVRG